MRLSIDSHAQRCIEVRRRVVYVRAARGLNDDLAQVPILGKGARRVHGAGALMDKTPPRSAQSWHAISVISSAQSCPAARALRGTRFLSSQAPPLPLKDCNQRSACTCTYKHHKDRRAGPRRASERSGLTRATPPAERRVKRGRRQSDFEA